jgi:hypothetical protein
MAKFYRALGMLSASLCSATLALGLMCSVTAFGDIIPGEGANDCTNCKADASGKADRNKACTGASGVCPGTSTGCPSCICLPNTLDTSQYCQ